MPERCQTHFEGRHTTKGLKAYVGKAGGIDPPGGIRIPETARSPEMGTGAGPILTKGNIGAITWEVRIVEYTAVDTYRGNVAWLRGMGNDCGKGTEEFGWET
ncbi:hypothetical protein L1987_29889 [Smallanthus sonchifolius]|uniref:Uncharacterized protein n=1 Tax=Smallanthus sonchifolius TaxID=185202 RepID=A0ACB9I2R3_9ASTR|nr:hypothetical protein L1987_29889 [Smallanthus sonchifolius]